MLETFLFFLLYATVLLFGVMLSYAFAGIHPSSRGILSLIVTFTICGALQLITYFMLGEQDVWELYPLITHFPIIAVIYAFHHKKFITAVSAVTAAYLCCQPANWAGILVATLTQNIIAEQLIRPAVLILICQSYG